MGLNSKRSSANHRDQSFLPHIRTRKERLDCLYHFHLDDTPIIVKEWGCKPIKSRARKGPNHSGNFVFCHRGSPRSWSLRRKARSSHRIGNKAIGHFKLATQTESYEKIPGLIVIPGFLPGIYMIRPLGNKAFLSNILIPMLSLSPIKLIGIIGSASHTWHRLNTYLCTPQHSSSTKPLNKEFILIPAMKVLCSLRQKRVG